MIQKKSLKDAIQNPEIISVVGGLIGDVFSKSFSPNPSALGLIPRRYIAQSDYSKTKYFQIIKSSTSQINGIFDIVCFKDHQSNYAYKKIQLIISPNLSNVIANVIQNECNNDFSLYYTFTDGVVTLYLEAQSAYFCAGVQSFITNATARSLDFVAKHIQEIPKEAVKIL